MNPTIKCVKLISDTKFYYCIYYNVQYLLAFTSFPRGLQALKRKGWCLCYVAQCLTHWCTYQIQCLLNWEKLHTEEKKISQIEVYIIRIDSSQRIPDTLSSFYLKSNVTSICPSLTTHSIIYPTMYYFLFQT